MYISRSQAAFLVLSSLLTLFPIPSKAQEASGNVQNARIDIFGQKDLIGLSVLNKAEDSKFHNINWGEKDKRKYALTTELFFRHDKQPRRAEFSFMPDKDGPVTISLTSQALRPRPGHEEDDTWVYFSSISANGTEIANGDMRGTDGSRPHGWSTHPQTSLSPLNGGGNEIRVCHRKRAWQTIQVRAGVPVCISLSTRPGEITPGKKTAAQLAPETIESGKWKLVLDRNNGNWHSLTYDGKIISTRSSFSLATNSKMPFSDIKLLSCDLSKSGGELSLTYAAGEWRVDEIIRFDAFGIPGLLQRQGRIVLNANTHASFHGLDIKYQIPETFEYLTPGSFCGDTRRFNEILETSEPKRHYRNPAPHRGVIAALPDNSKLSTAPFLNTFLFQTPDKDSIVFMADQRRDPVDITLNRKTSSGEVLVNINAHGWALPGQAQNLPPTYLRVCPRQDMASALADTMPAWFNAIDCMPPGDRPEWVLDAAVYGIDPRFGGGNGLQRASRMLERVRELGFNTLHVMPVQEGSYWYLPTDYFKISPVAGTAEDYRAFIKAAKERELRIWQDIVPHGSYPQQVRDRGNSALWIWYDRNGNSGKKYVLDFKNPEYQRYMYEVAQFHMKNYAIDGFRIDQPWGSISNWRREGFPARDSKPANIDVEWFRGSIDEAGGVMPPLPYERASLCLREGGLEMNRVIRRAVKDSRPRDGAIHSEVLGAQFAADSDLLYDLLFAIMTRKLIGLEPGEFAPALSQYLHEKMICSPPGTRYLRIFQNHDTISQFPSLGVAAARAAFAVAALSDGAPMMFQNIDIGHGSFISRLLSVRNERIELRRGNADYLAVKTGNPAVWCVLRSHDKQHSIVLVNFSNRRVNTSVSVPMEKLPLDGKDTYAWINAFNHDISASGKPGGLSTIPVSIDAFETIVLSCRPLGHTGTRKQTQVNEQPPQSPPAIIETPDKISVGNSVYKAVINRQTGMLEQFSSPDGGNVSTSSDLILARPTKTDATPSHVSVSRENDRVTVSCTVPLGGGKLEMNWIFNRDGIRLNAGMTEASGGEFAAIAFPINGADRWTVNTIEGVLDDSFGVAAPDNHKFIVPGGVSDYRDSLSCQALWNAGNIIPDPGAPFIRCLKSSGKGLEWEISDPLSGPPAEVALLKNYASTQYPALLFYFHSPDPLGSGNKLAFSINLRPAERKDSAEQFSKPISVAGMTISSESHSYVLENDHYRVKLHRLGGGIRELTRKSDGTTIIEDQKLLTSGICSSPNLTSPFSNAFDPEGGARIWLDGDTLRMRFLSIFRGSRRWHRPGRRLWALNEFAFDRSGTFRNSWQIYGDLEAIGTDNRVEWLAELHPDITIRQNRRNHVSLLKNNLLRAVIDEIQALDYSAANNTLKFDMFNKEHSFRPGRVYVNSCRISVSADPSPTPEPIPLSEFRPVASDCSFELWGSAHLFNHRKNIPFIFWKQYPALWALSSSSATFDNSTASDGLVSLRLLPQDNILVPIPENVLVKGDNTLSFDIRHSSMTASDKLIFTIHGSNESGGAVSGSVELQMPEQHRDWNAVSINITLSGKILVPRLEIRRTPGQGSINLDRVRFNDPNPHSGDSGK